MKNGHNLFAGARGWKKRNSKETLKGTLKVNQGTNFRLHKQLPIRRYVSFVSYSALKANSKVLQNSLVPPRPKAVEQHCSPNGSEIGRKLDRKRKRSKEAESPPVQDEPTEKRARLPLESGVVEDKTAARDSENKKGDPINYWIQKGIWPEEYFEHDINMGVPLARKKSEVPLLRQVLETNTVTSIQDTEDKSAFYKHPSYVAWLEDRGSFLKEFRQGIKDDSEDKCQILLNTKQTVPRESDTLFRDDLFQDACEKLLDRNEARVINDIARLIVPSAETLTTYGANHLEHLIVGMNERWNESIPLITTAVRPQPDFSVGFRRSAFTEDQLKRLQPLIGNVFAATKFSSFFLATWRMYFPFFTCEVECGLGGLDIADRQNANSMTIAVKGVVELFRFVKREKEIHRSILAFSISHDDNAVRIFGHYPVIDGDKTTFYRHTIKRFDFTSERGKEKWTAYQFTKNVYDKFMPEHYKLICSAINDIPVDLNFGVPSASFGSNPGVDTETESDSLEMAESAPSSQNTRQSKKPRLKPTAMLQQEIDWLKQQLAQEREEREERKQRHAELMKILEKKLG